MRLKNALLAAATLLVGSVTLANAQPPWVPPGNDPGGYYSQSDRTGYYDRDGRYRHIRSGGDRYDNGPPPPPAYDGPPPPPSGAYYEQGRYEENCHRGNAAAGTIFGALAGGLIGSGVSHGNGGAVVGGAVLGGLLGNTIARDIDCDDQPEAFRVYATGLNGDIGRRSDWRHGNSYGYFTPTREFRRDGRVCRDFTETSFRGGQSYTRTGTACRSDRGDWRFD